MRMIMLVVVCTLVGVGAGYGLTVAEFRGVEEHFAGRHLQITGTPQDEGADDEVAEVELLNGDEFNFGVLQRGQRRQHTFRIRNAGDAMLRLQFYGRSCGQCIATSFRGGEFARDQVIEVDVEYRTAKPDEDFVHYVEFQTNDERHPILRFYVKGKVTERVRLSGSAINVDKLSASESREESFQIYGYFDDELEVVSHDFSNPETADKFDVEVVDLDVAELEMNPQPRAAKEVRVRIAAGMPVGQINQTITLTLAAGEEVLAQMPIEGEVASDFSMRGGPEFNSFRNLLKFGRVARGEGATNTVYVFVRGPHRDNVEFSVESVDPSDIMQVEIKESKSLGQVRQVPIEISIRPGALPVNRFGNDQGKIGKITIATTHPDSKQLMIYSSFIVE